MLENIKQAKNWEDRYRFIIQAGKHLSQPSPDELAQMQSIVMVIVTKHQRPNPKPITTI